MKRIILPVFVLLTVVAPMMVRAQGIGLGLKGGVNFANQSIKQISQSVGDLSTDGRTGFHAGAYLVLAFSEKWAIQPEIMYSSQGAEIPTLNEMNKFNYMSIPVLLRWKPISLISIEAGPQFSSLLSVKDTNGDSIKENFKNGDFGLAAGATVHLPLGLNAGVRYIWGFNDISDVQDREVKNTLGQIFVGWTLFGSN
jgi:hypothetical protein